MGFILQRIKVILYDLFQNASCFKISNWKVSIDAYFRRKPRNPPEKFGGYADDRTKMLPLKDGVETPYCYIDWSDQQLGPKFSTNLQT